LLYVELVCSGCWGIQGPAIVQQLPAVTHGLGSFEGAGGRMLSRYSADFWVFWNVSVLQALGCTHL